MTIGANPDLPSKAPSPAPSASSLDLPDLTRHVLGFLLYPERSMELHT